MSSILNALKRVETDGSDNPCTHRRSVPWLPLEEVRVAWSDRLWGMLITSGRRWIATGLTLVALVGAGVLVGSLGPAFFHKLQHQQPTTVIAPPRTTVSPAKAMLPIHHPDTTPPPFNDPSSITSPVVTSAPKAGQQDTLSVAGSSALPTTGDSVAEHSPPNAGALPSTLGIARPLPPSQPNSATENHPIFENFEKPAGPPVAPPLPIEAELNLQAVSWSEAAQRRIAVINDRVLHTGEAIDGYTVSRIDPEAVILLRAGATYRLTFRSR